MATLTVRRQPLAAALLGLLPPRHVVRALRTEPVAGRLGPERPRPRRQPPPFTAAEVQAVAVAIPAIATAPVRPLRRPAAAVAVAVQAELLAVAQGLQRQPAAQAAQQVGRADGQDGRRGGGGADSGASGDGGRRGAGGGDGDGRHSAHRAPRRRAQAEGALRWQPRRRAGAEPNTSKQYLEAVQTQTSERNNRGFVLGAEEGCCTGSVPPVKTPRTTSAALFHPLTAFARLSLPPPSPPPLARRHFPQVLTPPTAPPQVTADLVKEFFSGILSAAQGFNPSLGPAVANVQLSGEGKFGFVEFRDEVMAATALQVSRGAVGYRVRLSGRLAAGGAEHLVWG